MNIIRLICFGGIITGCLWGGVFALYQTSFLARRFAVVIKKSLSPANIVVKFNHIYSDDIRNQLIAFFDAWMDEKEHYDFHPASFSRQIKQQCALIDSIRWQYTAPGQAELSFTGVVPVINVNKRLVLAQGTRLYSCDDFPEFNNESLPQLRLSKEALGSQVASSLRTFLHRIPSEIWRDYVVVYKKPTHIALHSKTKAFYTIFTDETSIRDRGKIATILAVHADLDDRTKNMAWRRRGQRNRHWVFDVRFKDRIVVKPTSHAKRGRG